jgi:MFS family permease
MLYTVFSLPNIVLPLIGGIFLDRIGLQNCLVICMILTTVGQGIVAFGGYQASFYTLILGRFILGLGAETLMVVQSVFITKWFLDGGLMQFATGVCIGVPFVFDFSSGFILNKAYDLFGLGFALSIGFIVCVVSTVCGFALIRL